MTDLKALASNAGYGAAADALAAQYEGIPFRDVHRHVLHLFPSEPSAVLDIGAGTGRDAAALAGQGHAVVAVEPTAELRSLGERIHEDQDIEWLDDALPELTGLRGDRRFDLILLTAVWMHLDEYQRPSGMARLAGLLAPEGRVILSLRHGPVPAGRRMFEVTAEETIELALDHGLTVEHLSGRADPHHRPGVTWDHLSLRTAAGCAPGLS